MGKPLYNWKVKVLWLCPSEQQHDLDPSIMGWSGTLPPAIIIQHLQGGPSYPHSTSIPSGPNYHPKKDAISKKKVVRHVLSSSILPSSHFMPKFLERHAPTQAICNPNSPSPHAALSVSALQAHSCAERSWPLRRDLGHFVANHDPGIIGCCSCWS